MQALRTSDITRKSYLFLAVLVFLTFGHTLNYSFVWDDNKVLDDPVLEDFPITKIPSLFTKPLWASLGVTEYEQVFYRPLSAAFGVMQYKLWRQNPWGYRLVSIMLHLLCAIVVYKVCLLMSCQRASALFGASLFAVHPVNVESVVWISAASSFTGIFVILSVYAFMKDRLFPSLAMFALGLLSKEVVIMLPAAMLVFSVHRDGVKKGTVKLLPFFMAAVVYLGVRALILGHNTFGGGMVQPMQDRIPSMLVAMADYMRLLVFPFYLRPFYPAAWYASLTDPRVMVSALLLIAAAAFVYFRFRRDRDLLFLSCMLFVFLIPPVWFVNVLAGGGDESAYIAERYLYMSTMSLSIMAALYASRMGNAARKIVMSSLIVLFMALAVLQSTIWKDGITFFTRIARDNPASLFAHSGLGGAYLKEGRFDEAREHLLFVIGKNPFSTNAINAHISLGNVYLEQRQFDRAISEYRYVLSIRKDDRRALHNLQAAYALAGEKGAAAGSE